MTATDVAAVSYADIPHAPRRWLWEGRIPYGVVVYAAAGGTGKGLLFAAAAARTALGLPFPGDDQDSRPAPRRVVWITGAGEDDQFEDLAPRLRAAVASAAAEFGLGPEECAAGLARIFDLSEWADGTPVTLPADCGRLASEVAALGAGGVPVGLVVADSLTALLSEGSTIDSRQGARRVMGRLARFARESDVPLAVLHHFTKDGRVAGSPAVLDGVRLAFTIGRDPDRPGVRTITEHKANASNAAPCQYVIAGSGAGVHAVFTVAGDARAERASRGAGPPPATSFRGRMARSAEPTAAETRAGVLDDGVSVPEYLRRLGVPTGAYRCLARVQLPGRPPEAGRLLADRVSADAARAAAESDACTPLTWQTAPSGMDVAVHDRADGARVSYGVYPRRDG